MHLIIGSRGSDLALYQANLIASFLAERGASTEIKIIKTVGDKIDNLSFDKMEGKSFFTKELEDALLAREIDLAVHSLKDLSTTMPAGLKVGAYCSPEDPSELLLVRPEFHDSDQKLHVKSGCVIGTSSVRRQAQIAYLRPDLKIQTLRGNVPTRIRKLRDRQYDAILVARAGVQRLGLDLTGLEAYALDPLEFIPAPGQGILAIQIRNNDGDTENIVSQFNEDGAEETARLERGLLARFQGGCQLPLAVTSEKRGGGFHLKAFLGARDGEGWGKPSFYSGHGDSIEELIEGAFSALSGHSDKKKVLVTRPEAEASHLFENLSTRLEPVYYPVFTIVPDYEPSAVDTALSKLDEFAWLIFTSKNSVAIFLDILKDYGCALPSDLNVAAVGRKTCELLESHGVRVAFVPEREDSVGLVEGLSSTLGNSHASILLPQGEEAPDTIEHGLGTPGHKVTRINIYRTVPTSAAELPDIGIDDIGFFIFTSPLSVSYFKALGHKLPEKAWVAAIGQPTAKALISDFRAPDFVPGKADLKAIVEKIKERL